MDLFLHLSESQKQAYLKKFNALEFSRISIKNNIELLRLLSNLDVKLSK